jgi:hypothetical protein
MGKLHSTTQTKELLDAIFSTTDAVVRSLKDGKIGFEDVAYFIPVFPKIELAIRDGVEIPKELADLDKEEAEDLKNYIQEKFDIENDVLEKRIEDALGLVLSLYTFIKGIMDDLKHG